MPPDEEDARRPSSEDDAGRGGRRRVAVVGSQAFALLNFRSSLISALVAAGHQVLALAPDLEGEYGDHIRRLGARPISLALSRRSTNPAADATLFAQLLSILLREKPDTVLAYTAKPIIYGMPAALLAGVRGRFALVEGLGLPLSGDAEGAPRLLRRLVRGLYRLAIGAASRCFFLNQNDLGDFVSWGIVEPGRATLLGATGLNLEDWPNSQPVVDPVTFIFVGRLLRQKGVEEFVAAARSVKLQHPAARFLLVGGFDTGHDAIAPQAVERWVAEGIVEWTGHVPVRPWLDQSSVFVLPSYREGYPRSTQEAMAVGRAVITTDVPGCRDTVVDGQNGLLVEPRNPRALADAMRAFIASPELIVRMGRESRAISERLFDSRSFDDRLIRQMGL